MRFAVLIAQLEIATLSVCAGGQASNRVEPSPGSQPQLEAFLKLSADDVARKYLDHPPYSLLAIRRLIELADPAVKPALRHAFEEEGDVSRRQFIAAALVRLRDQDDLYFNYVQDAARAAINSPLPFPGFLSHANGAGPSGYRPEFLKVVREGGFDLDDALQLAAIELPGTLEALGEAADARAYPLLLDGLYSPNIAIVRASAFGLARLHENAAALPIIAACARFSKDERPIIAKALLYFDSQSARSAAASIIGNRPLLERWRKEAAERGWRNAMRDSLR